MKLALLLVALGGCGFDPNSDTYLGGDDGGLSWIDARGSGDAGSGTQLDAGVPPPSIDAAPTVLTLREAASDANAGATDDCIEDEGSVTTSESYARLFSLSDYSSSGIPNGHAFQVTAIQFVAALAHNANGLTISVGDYAGAVGAQTLDPTMTTPLAAELADATVTNQIVTVPIAATIPAGHVAIIEIDAPSYADGGGVFAIGGASGAESQPSYFASASCGATETPVEPPTDKDPRTNASVGSFIIDMVGYAQ